MRPFPLSIQLYSLREEAKKDFIAVLKQVAAMGYQGVEFAGLHGYAPAEIRKVLDDLGLKVSSVHGPTPSAENKNQIVDEAMTLGYTRHISGRRRENYATLEETLQSAEVFAQAVELLKGTGISYGIHNHEFEFDKEFEGKTPHQIVMEKVPDLFAQIDTYWVKTAGKDPAQVIADYGRRAPVLHIKDGPCVRGQGMTAVGEGIIDWEPVIAAADKSNVDTMFERWTATLKAGGDVWVKEGGQSDLTAEVLRRINKEMPEIKTAERIHVVQHSDKFNEGHTTKEALAYTKENSDYIRIKNANEYLNMKPGDGEFIRAAAAHPVHGEAWKAAFEYLDPHVRLDFSDTGELMHILALGEIGNVEFGQRYLGAGPSTQPATQPATQALR